MKIDSEIILEYVQTHNSVLSPKLTAYIVDTFNVSRRHAIRVINNLCDNGRLNRIINEENQHQNLIEVLS